MTQSNRFPVSGKVDASPLGEPLQFEFSGKTFVLPPKRLPATANVKTVHQIVSSKEP